MREEIALAHPCLRAEIARRVCQRLGWRTSGGSYAVMSARVALLRLEAKGLIELPAPRNGNGNGKVWQPTVGLEPPPQPLEASLSALGPIQLQIVSTAEQSGLWNSLVAHYHYLGHSNLPGAQLRYLVYARQQVLGAIGFGAAAWSLAARDRVIGWTAVERRRALPLVLNNARFLLLPWVRVAQLASHILGRCARQLPMDFGARYGWRPVLLETFVQEPHRGTCYRAARWIYLGQTQGRGKKGPHPTGKQTPVPLKHLWIYPLVADFRSVLCAEEPFG